MMDELLAAIGSQAMKYAIKSGIALTSQYALGQCTRLLTAVDEQNISGRKKNELSTLQELLESKIKVIAPTIDLIDFKSGRGNVCLDAALPLTKSIQRDVVSLGERIELTAANIEHPQATLPRAQIDNVIVDIKELLSRIDREIPLLQLAITASGESLSSSLPPGISPSRLLQASTLLSLGDTQFSEQPDKSVQIGPDFNLSLFMLFVGHAPPSQSHPDGKGKGPYGLNEGDRKPLWQEIIHKARVRLYRAPCQTFTDREASAFKYSYYIDIVEDRNDDRVHEPVGADPEIDGYHSRSGILYIPPGIEECIPVHQVSKIFYTDSGRLLNIGGDAQDEKKPVLLFKRDINSTARSDTLGEYRNDHLKDSQRFATEEVDTQTELDRQLLEDQTSARLRSHARRETRENVFPKHLDPEWIAMEMYEEALDEDDSTTELFDREKELELLFGDNTHNRALPKTPGSPKSLVSPNPPRSFMSPRSPMLPRPPMSPRSPKSPESPGLRMGRKSLQYELEEERRFSKAELRALPLRSPEYSAKEEPRIQLPNASAATRSPFGGITTSLSLIEMLIRLASLQEFQQASHLTIPDHILAFFLEETSTTGLVGEAQWRARNEAKTRVGFDPYSDSPGEGKE